MEKLRRYDTMRQALKNIPEEIRHLKDEAEVIRRASLDWVSARGSRDRKDEALLNNIAQRQELEWTLKLVRQWLAITDRGLLALPEDERLIGRLCAELGVEQSTIYRKRDQALERFTASMYGFCET